MPDALADKDYAGPVPFKGGYEASLEDALNRSGNRRSRGGSRRGGFRYTGGPFRGLTMDEAVARHRADYTRLPDHQKRAWEARAGMRDVRSSRERSAGDSYAGPTLQRTPGPVTSAGYDALSPAAKAQQIGIFGSEKLARAAWKKAGAPDAPGTAINTSAEAVASLGGSAAPATLSSARSPTNNPPAGGPMATPDPPRVGMINGMPAGEAVAQAKADASVGHREVAGFVDDSGQYLPPSGGGELVGLDGDKPLYRQTHFDRGDFAKLHRQAQADARTYAGPTSTFSTNPTQADAASGVETPGDALRKRRLPRAA